MKPIPFNALAKILDLDHSNQNLILGAAIDSRKIRPGDLFFALPGNRVDGHYYLQEAALKGASGAIVRSDYQDEDYGLPLLRVPDVLFSLQELARRILQKRASKVVAISGTIGKTTTKGFAETLLRTSYKVFASPLSYNSQATVPLSILMADGDEDILILEMGMSKPGEIEKLISIAPPDVALITTVAIQHATHFPEGILAISKEKATLFSHPKTRLGIFHHDILYDAEVANSGTCLKKRFSVKNRVSDYYMEVANGNICIYPEEESPFEMALNLPFPACYQNFLASVALARAFEVPWSSIRDNAHLLKLPPMRFERCVKRGVTFINDAYNANMESMREALENLPKPEIEGKTIGVLGEMNDLGAYSEEAHTLVGEIALQRLDALFCIGERCATIQKVWRQNKRSAELFKSKTELVAALKEFAKPGDVVLLKGARAFALDEILNYF